MTAAPATPELVELAGTVESLRYQKPTFCIGKLNTPRRNGIVFKVHGYVKAGQQLKLRGKWVNHKTFGPQFEASEVVCELPSTPAGIAQWLTWNVEGVGVVIARKLTDEFGVDLMPLAAADPGQVAAVCGVPLETIERIAAAWQESSAKIAVQSRLAGWGLTHHQVEMITAKWGGTAATVVEENPYMLLGEVDGLGWAKIDEIALKCGMPRNDERRAAAALQYAMSSSQKANGHTCLPEDTAIAMVAELLGDDADFAHSAAAKLALMDRLVFVAEPGPLGEPAKSPTFYASPHDLAVESRLWKWFARGAEPHGWMEHLRIPEAIAFDDAGALTLDESQAAAVRLAMASRCSVITGGAGVGKTSIVKAIVRLFGLAPVSLLAPTGKAARRLSEVVGRNASTIHRALGYHPDAGFVHNELNPLPDGVYICDEVSMCDTAILDALLRALPERKETTAGTWTVGSDGISEDYGPPYRKVLTGGSVLILIGDEHQLPPVGPGAVLRDLLAHRLVPAARLTKCHRAAGVLKRNTAALNEGEVAQSDMTGQPPPWVVHNGLRDAAAVVKAVRRLYEEHLRAWGFDPVRDVQFMTAKHAGKLGTKYLNRLLQWMHQATLGVTLDEPTDDDDRRPPLYIGDKVIHTKNNYELDVMNGTVGVVIGTSPLTVEYDDGVIEYPDKFKGEVELAYVLTVHKMQGSQVPCAVVICHRTNSFMQTRNWIYTAASRAQRSCVIIGDDESIRRAASRTDPNRRCTLLQVFAGYEGTRPK